MGEGVEGNWPVGTTSVREAVTQSSTPQGRNRYLLLGAPCQGSCSPTPATMAKIVKYPLSPTCFQIAPPCSISYPIFVSRNANLSLIPRLHYSLHVVWERGFMKQGQVHVYDVPGPPHLQLCLLYMLN